MANRSILIQLGGRTLALTPVKYAGYLAAKARRALWNAEVERSLHPGRGEVSSSFGRFGGGRGQTGANHVARNG